MPKNNHFWFPKEHINWCVFVKLIFVNQKPFESLKLL